MTVSQNWFKSKAKPHKEQQKGDEPMIKRCINCGFELITVTKGKLYLDSLPVPVTKVIKQHVEPKTSFPSTFWSVDIYICPKCGTVFINLWSTDEHSIFLTKVGNITDQMKAILISAGMSGESDEQK